MSSTTNTTPGAAAAAATAAVPSKLQMLNYVNVVAYISNFLVVFGSTRAGLPDNATLSDKYQTLVTPAGYAFSIWGIIFTAELVWTIAQLFPSYRSHELVVKGVGYNFSLASFAQCQWTIFFGREKISLSLIAMVSILVPLLSILTKTSSMTTTTTTSEYWLLKFPFQIHASWIMAATLVNVNVLSVACEASSTVQTAIGWASLVVLFGVGIYYAALMKNKRSSRNSSSRVLVVPCVLVWASFAISKELSSPRDQIKNTFSETIVQHTKIASMVVAYLLVLVMIVELVRSRFFPPGTITTVAVAEVDSDGEVLDSEVLDSNGEGESDGQ
jgi:benzodiazapine receptor